MYAEILAQTHTGSMIVASVPVNPHDPGITSYMFQSGAANTFGFLFLLFGKSEPPAHSHLRTSSAMST